MNQMQEGVAACRLMLESMAEPQPYRSPKALELFQLECRDWLDTTGQLIIHPILTDKELTDLRIRAHKLKGSSGMLGFMELSTKAGEIEQCLKVECPVDELVSRIRLLLEQIRPVVSSVEGAHA